MKKVYFLTIVLISISASLFSQNSSQVVSKDEQSYLFGQIYTSFYYCNNDLYSPKSAFVFDQGIIGYKHKLSEKLSGIIIYDVTRTTHFFDITDSLGNKMNYNYFEGSKYTSFLKMAEINWKINDFFTFKVGQLLNTQYLTFQDKFWGFRYVDVTIQEKFRMGMPADFGAQIDFKYKDKFLNQFSVVNGEGPFRYQDENGKFLYSNNIQYYPNKNITLKLYADYSPVASSEINKTFKSVISAFAGYKTSKFRIGIDYAYIFNAYYSKNNYLNGISVFGSYNLNDKISLLARYDRLAYSHLFSKTNYFLAGVEYEPIDKFTSSLNFRYYSQGELPFIYANFGLKF